MEVAWDEIVFNDHMLAPVPEEGVSRLVTQQTSERRDHYVRYGIALILEHGFMVSFFASLRSAKSLTKRLMAPFRKRPRASSRTR